MDAIQLGTLITTAVLSFASIIVNLLTNVKCESECFSCCAIKSEKQIASEKQAETIKEGEKKRLSGEVTTQDKKKKKH